MAVYLIFWDGVGYGKVDPETNPFFAARLPALSTLCGDNLFSLRHTRVSTPLATVSSVNATLGVAGLPQSGTGQTALFAGVNAAKIVGRHFGPYPYSTLVPIIKEKNIFKRLRHIGARVRFANGFPDRYIDYLSAHPSKMPVVALAFASVNGGLHTHDDIRSGSAISADIIGSRWKELGHAGIEAVQPESAGHTFHELGSKCDFILFEYFITDKAGHAQNMTAAVEALERADRFIDGLLTRFDFARDTLVLISDHGNIEDLSVKTHTRNPVPLIVAGKRKDELTRAVRTLTGLTPAVTAIIASDLAR
ncbi:MAG TPA: peptidase [Bacteroidota bacterium]|nr:peptidase [Bacteroidota bacterium]